MKTHELERELKDAGFARGAITGAYQMWSGPDDVSVILDTSKSTVAPKHVQKVRKIIEGVKPVEAPGARRRLARPTKDRLEDTQQAINRVLGANAPRVQELRPLPNVRPILPPPVHPSQEKTLETKPTPMAAKPSGPSQSPAKLAAVTRTLPKKNDARPDPISHRMLTAYPKKNSQRGDTWAWTILCPRANALTAKDGKPGYHVRGTLAEVKAKMTALANALAPAPVPIEVVVRGDAYVPLFLHENGNWYFLAKEERINRPRVWAPSSQEASQRIEAELKVWETSKPKHLPPKGVNAPTPVATTPTKAPKKAPGRVPSPIQGQTTLYFGDYVARWTDETRNGKVTFRWRFVSVDTWRTSHVIGRTVGRSNALTIEDLTRDAAKIAAKAGGSSQPLVEVAQIDAKTRITLARKTPPAVRRTHYEIKTEREGVTPEIISLTGGAAAAKSSFDTLVEKLKGEVKPVSSPEPSSLQTLSVEVPTSVSIDFSKDVPLSSEPQIQEKIMPVAAVKLTDSPSGEYILSLDSDTTAKVNAIVAQMRTPAYKFLHGREPSVEEVLDRLIRLGLQHAGI